MTWFVDKLLGPIIVAVVVAVIMFVSGLIALPGRVERLEKQTEKVPDIFKSVGGLEADQKNFKETSDKAIANVNDFNTKLLALGQANAELKAHVDNLKNLSTDIRDLRKSIDELRVSVGTLTDKLKMEPAKAALPEAHYEVSTQVYLTPENLKREGEVWIANLTYPDRLVNVHKVREIKTRLVSVLVVQGSASITTAAEKRETGYSLVATTSQPDAIAAFLKKGQPLRVEVVFVMDR